MNADWYTPHDDGFRTTEEIKAARRAGDLKDLTEYRLYGPREKYLRQLKHCMKYGQTIVVEAKRIRKWGSVKKPDFEKFTKKIANARKAELKTQITELQEKLADLQAQLAELD